MQRYLRISLLGVMTTACSDYSFTPDKDLIVEAGPRIDVTPRSLSFLPTIAGDTDVRTFTVTSIGGTTLAIDGIDVEPTAGERSSFRVLTPTWPEFLEPLESFSVEIAYEPLFPGIETGLVWVRSSDPEEPSLAVNLNGEGLVPSLEVSPEAIDFGTLPLGCSDAQSVRLRNVGAATLVLDALTLAGDADLSLQDVPSLPLPLEPGESTTIRVAYTANTAATVQSTLSAASNDPFGDRTGTQQGTGETPSSAREVFTVDEDPPLDIVLAVDQSCSMDDDQASLAANFSDFILQLEAITSNWHLGVVTTDDACFLDGPYDASTTDLFNRFAAAVQYGEDRDIEDDEALLKMATAALDHAADASCNTGFRREEAGLHVVVVSDEPERSGEQAAAWSWEFWWTALQVHAAGGPGLRVSGVVDASGCNEGDAGYRDIIAATGGARLDICTADWADAVADIAQASVTLAWSFPLQGEPLDGTAQVVVDGVPNTDWTWAEERHAVTFSTRPPGTEVVVTYDVAAECPPAL